MRHVLLGVLLAASARAQSLTVVIMDAPGLSDSQLKKAHRAAVDALKAVVALPVADSFEKPPKKSCSKQDLACQRDRLKTQGVALWLDGVGDAVQLDAAFFLDGERLSEPKSGSDPKALLEQLVPGWMRKGWGGVRLGEELPPGALLKLDGRVVTQKKQDVVAVTAGKHQLDVVFPDGRAVLQTVEVQEASRTRVDVAPPPGVQMNTGSSGLSALRVTSYAAWMVGAATLLSAFIVAFVGRQTANGQNPCTAVSRECTTFAEAQEQSRRAAGYAATANVLLGTGLVLSLAGAGLFTVDALR